MEKDNKKTLKTAYQEILKVCEKHKSIYTDRHQFDDIKQMISSAKDHLRVIEWQEQFGLDISHDKKPNSYNHITMTEYTSFSYYRDALKEKENGTGRYIFWSDDDRQPKDEWLFIISFPTGPYIFGQDYDGQKSLFQDFFKELKTYNPDYMDTCNKTLYWKLENAKGIFDNFVNVISEYRKRNKSEFNKRKADKLRKELKQLEEQKEA